MADFETVERTEDEVRAERFMETAETAGRVVEHAATFEDDKTDEAKSEK